MRICVYGAASTMIDKKYTEAVERLSEKLARRGHNLVFGAGDGGVMGAAARGFHKGGGKVMGVSPAFFTNGTVEKIYEECDTLVLTEDMGTRKSVMEMNADAFITAPGGIGTYDEFFQVITLKQLHVFDKPIVLFNVEHFYDSIGTLLKLGMYEKFLRADTPLLYRMFDETEMDKIVEYIEGYDKNYTKNTGETIQNNYGHQ